MPRDSSGNYTLPPGNPVTAGTVITSEWANTTMGDVGNEITGSLSRSGQGGMLSPLQFVDGSQLTPGITFVQEPTLGFYRKATATLALGALGEEQMTYDANNNRFSLSEGANTQMSISPSIADGRPSYVLRDPTGFVRAEMVFDHTSGQVALIRYDSTGNIETVFTLTDDGNVTVSGVAPTADNQLARKDYVDANGGGGGSDLYVLKSGDIMTGQLQGITPVSDPDLTRKDYVDTLIAGVGGSAADRVLRSGDTMTGQLGLPGGGAGLEAAAVQEVQDAIVDYQLLSEKGAPSGYCPLNSNSLVPVTLLPLTNVEFYGGWDASAGNLPPTPPSGGAYYIITVAGTLNVVPADGSSQTPTPTAVDPGDDIIYSDITLFWYQVIPNLAQEDARYVQLVGSTMTGDLNLNNGTTDSPQVRFQTSDLSDYYWDLAGGNARMITHYQGGGAATPFMLNIQTGQANFTGSVVSTKAPTIADETTYALQAKASFGGGLALIDGAGAIVQYLTGSGDEYNLSSGPVGAATTFRKLLISSTQFTAYVNGVQGMTINAALTATFAGALFSSDIHSVRSGSVAEGYIYFGQGSNYFGFNGSQFVSNGSNISVTPAAPVNASDLTRKDYVDLNKLDSDFLRTGDRLDIFNVRTS